MKKVPEGIRVIDLSHVLAVPTATILLADLGAGVIHLEPPQGGDAREYGPFAGEPDKNRSGYFISLNRNKKSLVLNLKLDSGDTFRSLRASGTCPRCPILSGWGNLAAKCPHMSPDASRAMNMNL
jgi:crotonobetainyl-CoA:carnitine CoA-transferase CaiB-like acyl-CoA transferase